ncbi:MULTISPECIES: hypothetical protein [unclassified Bartonella]|uniref:hypothetical protein n=1 Tax=unclassified Bartonella TaxID=2645622 RepID=UPI0035D0FA61
MTGKVFLSGRKYHALCFRLGRAPLGRDLADMEKEGMRNLWGGGMLGGRFQQLL